MSKVSNDNFVVIQGWMINELQLKGNELLVYAIIYGFSQDGVHWFKGSRQYLADWTNSSKQGISKNLISLVEKGLLEKQDRSVNGVKFVDYRATQLTTLVNKVDYPSKQSLPGGGQQSLPHNIEIYNLEDKNTNNVDELFEELWKMYPNKRGKGQISDAKKKKLFEIGREHMARAITRYLNDLKLDTWRKPQNGSTFFNSGYVDYLDENYSPPERKGSNRFTDYEQRNDIDYDKIEKLLMNKGVKTN